MNISGIQCQSCGDVIWSRHAHDFRRCSCEAIFIDGGREYLRCGGNAENIVMVTIVKTKAQLTKKSKKDKK